MLFTLAAGLLFWVGCSTVEDRASGGAEQREAVRVVHQGNEGDRRSTVHIIRTAEQLRRAPVSETLRETVADRVDFRHEAAVVFFAGTRTTGGYALELGEVNRTEERLLIRIIEIPPAPDAMVTQALTYPHIIVAVEDAPATIIVDGPGR